MIINLILVLNFLKEKFVISCSFIRPTDVETNDVLKWHEGE